MNFIKRWFFHNPYRYLASIIIIICISVVNLFINEFKFYYFCNGLMIASLSLIFVGGIATVTYFGAFDMFGYGFSRMFGNRKGYKDFVDYVDRASTTRRKRNYPFIPYYVVGVFSLLIALLLNLFI